MPLQQKKRRKFALVCCGVAAVAVSALPMFQRARQDAQPPVPASSPASLAVNGSLSAAEIVVDLRDDVTDADINDLNTRLGLQLRPNSMEARDDKLMRATIPAGSDMAGLLRTLRDDPRVEAAEPESRFAVPETPELEAAPPNAPATGARGLLRRGWVPNDPRFSEQWNFHMIGAGSAWDHSHGKGIVVAVIDTGIAAKNSARGRRARDFDRTNFVAGYDFVHDDEDPYDDHGHGTHVAGTIAESTNNREGVAGLAFEATLMPLKVLDSDGFGNSADVADAIRYAADHGANIINLSLGSAYPSEIIEKAVAHAQRKGVLLVCAAGNGFGEPVGYPAAYPGCVAVSAVGPTGDIAFYSSYGPQVALAAPGGDMMTGGLAGGILQNTIWSEDIGGNGDSYYPFQGTSMATPHVAATAALLMAQGVKDASRVRDILIRSATPHEGPRLQYGAGILSAQAATDTAQRQIWAGWFKDFIWGALALPLLWGRRDGRSDILRAFMTGAFWLGAFGPDWVAGYVGADSMWNLLSFSALAPFLLFWELEDRRNSRIVTALSLGVGLCLLLSCWGGILSPFTATQWGWTALPWTLTNLVAVLILAAYSWERGRATR